MYWEKTITYGNRITKRKYHALDAQGRRRRRQKEKPTEESVRKANERNAERRLSMLLIQNFFQGDWHVVLTYDPDNRPELELSKKLLKNYLRRMRRLYEKRGHVLKYVVVTEWQGKRIHHHIVINDLPELARHLRDQWGYGGIHMTPLYKEQDYEGLARYLVKETKETFNKPGCPFRQRWSCSKNLDQPKVVKRLVKADSWREVPEVPPALAAAGYILDRDSIINDVDIFGYPFQEYTMINKTWQQKRSGGNGGIQSKRQRGIYNGHHKGRDRNTEAADPNRGSGGRGKRTAG